MAAAHTITARVPPPQCAPRHTLTSPTASALLRARSSGLSGACRVCDWVVVAVCGLGLALWQRAVALHAAARANARVRQLLALAARNEYEHLMAARRLPLYQESRCPSSPCLPLSRPCRAAARRPGGPGAAEACRCCCHGLDRCRPSGPRGCILRHTWLYVSHSASGSLC